ncbi:GNAT family N-acetyltransferase [Nostoc sp. FACHB-152]|uniref:GNAT family N-acetyltransferase n=1 Tax=unclassified Nostoc TaxID=2593658 RepID=UPI001684A0CF|nr:MULTISPECIES: GNAT family N-acetyltransferase [unclassified Nostoc]MBD2448951.1 GNAT family N-acetyltransferase [Nostoc sp. FACHB-152]MBD2469419.1 GNAT family N-acetyltransferase [Nostoc sp. FACHB-145]
MATLKTLQPGDEKLLENFLLQHTETSMFLRSNWREAGLIDQGARFQGTYVAAIADDETIVAVAAHYWNGMVVVQAPVHLAEVVQAVVTQSNRAISGIAGPTAQVEMTKEVLRLVNRQTQLDESEILFSLSLADLQIPPALTLRTVQCRLPYLEEFELLSQWCAAYNVETLGQLETPDLLSTCRQEIEARQTTARHWVLVNKDMPIAYTAFNALLPDIVQIGGVWTPPPLRGKGYAKCVVAGSLLEARSHGVKRAILFTNRENYAAQAAYRGIGFCPTGEEFGLVIFSP